MVHCQLLDKKELEGLTFQTWPGELEKRIYEHISQQAWSQWIQHQTLLINEHRLSPLNPDTASSSRTKWKNSSLPAAPRNRKVTCRRKNENKPRHEAGVCQSAISC